MHLPLGIRIPSYCVVGCRKCGMYNQGKITSSRIGTALRCPLLLRMILLIYVI
jgi:hypothetical protein